MVFYSKPSAYWCEIGREPPINSPQLQVLGSGPLNPASGASTHVIVHRVGVDEVGQEVAAPEEDDVPQDVGH